MARIFRISVVLPAPDGAEMMYRCPRYAGADMSSIFILVPFEQIAVLAGVIRHEALGYGFRLDPG